MTNQLPFGSERVPVLFPVGISCILLVPLRAAERRVLPQRAQHVPLPARTQVSGWAPDRRINLTSRSHSRANSMTSVTSVGSVAERAMKKIRWRILPLVFLIYVVAFLDRANV